MTGSNGAYHAQTCLLRLSDRCVHFRIRRPARRRPFSRQTFSIGLRGLPIMNFDGKVLRAMLRLARSRQMASFEAVAVRVGGTLRDVRVSARRLRAAGLLEMRPDALRLTMAGFAVAVAMLPAKAGTRVPPRRSSRAA